MAVASNNRFPGETLYLAPRWNVVLYQSRWHEDNHAVGILRVFGSFEELRGAALGPTELITEAEARVADLYGKSVPNDFDALPSTTLGSWQHLDV